MMTDLSHTHTHGKKSLNGGSHYNVGKYFGIAGKKKECQNISHPQYGQRGWKRQR